MDNIKNLIEKKYKVIICIFFAIYLLVGISIFKDYGISWDETVSRTNGVEAVKYVLTGDQGLFRYSDKYYGTAFEMPLVLLEMILGLSENAQAVFFMRHLATFLLFYMGVLFFYLLCKRRFGSWKIGLLGSLFLILSPRIFAHSFYNSKDIACMAMFIVSMYTFVKLLDKKSLPRIVVHALACALLIDIRLVGVFVPFITLAFLIFDNAVYTKEIKIKRTIVNILVYVFFLILFVILFWPLLWQDPIYHFKEAFIQMSHFPGSYEILYLGKHINSLDIPWHYIPLWILISTPLLYTGFFLVGSSISIKRLIKNPVRFYCNKRDDIIFVLWFFLPLIAVIVTNAVLYDAWRQMFFIYPAFLMVALSGVVLSFEYISKRFKGVGRKAVSWAFILIVAFSLIGTFQSMVRYHPYQNVYFNMLAGRNMKDIRKNFELDYWGLSYREALEYILKNDKSKIIKIYAVNRPGRISAVMLPLSDMKRLRYVKSPEEAEYFLSNHRVYKTEYPYKNEYYSVKIDGTKIMVVYKMQDQDRQ